MLPAPVLPNCPLGVFKQFLSRGSISALYRMRESSNCPLGFFKQFLSRGSISALYRMRESPNCPLGVFKQFLSRGSISALYRMRESLMRKNWLKTVCFWCFGKDSVVILKSTMSVAARATHHNRESSYNIIYIYIYICVCVCVCVCVFVCVCCFIRPFVCSIP